jgi:hypothetical protein
VGSGCRRRLGRDGCRRHDQHQRAPFAVAPCSVACTKSTPSLRNLGHMVHGFGHQATASALDDRARPADNRAAFHGRRELATGVRAPILTKTTSHHRLSNSNPSLGDLPSLVAGRSFCGEQVELRDRVEQEVPVLLKRLDGGDRAQTSPSPGGNGGPWDREMPGERPRTSAEHLLPQTVVVGTARLWRGREVGHRASIARRGSASAILSDSEGGALAYSKLGKVFARSWAKAVRHFQLGPRLHHARRASGVVWHRRSAQHPSRRCSQHAGYSGTA